MDQSEIKSKANKKKIKIATEKFRVKLCNCDWLNNFVIFNSRKLSVKWYNIRGYFWLKS